MSLPSRGISADWPLISGRKQGQVTRSGGRGEYLELWVKGAGRVGVEELSRMQVPGLTPSQPGSSLLPILCPRRQYSSLVQLGLDRTGL